MPIYERERYTASTRSDYSGADLRQEFQRIQRGIPHPTVVDVRDFGVRANGTADDTDALQRAIDASVGVWDADTGSARYRLYIPPGKYAITQLTIPDNAWIEGSHSVGFGEMAGTRLVQIANADVDLLRFSGHASGSWQFAAHVVLKHLRLHGNATQGTTTHAIHFMTSGGTAVIPQDPCIFENIHIRNFNGDGMRFPNGGVPLVIGPHVYIHLCAGAGVRVLEASSNLSKQSIHFDGLSGDGNIDGLVVATAIGGNANPLTMLFTNIKSEANINSTYGSATACSQRDALVFDTCTNLRVIIDGLNCNLGPNTSDNLRSAIRLTGAVPKIWYRGVATYHSGSLTGTAVTIRDEVNTVDVARTTDAGFYGSTTQEHQGTHVFQGEVQHDDDVVFTQAANTIRTDTADGADNAQLGLTPASGLSNTRGGYVIVYGNEHATAPGRVLVGSGNAAGSDVVVQHSGTDAIYVTRSGSLNYVTQGGTAGAATTATRVVKSVTAFTDAVAKTILTVTIPNATHRATVRVVVDGALGAGGAVGAGEGYGTIAYDFVVGRFAGADTTMVASAAYGSATGNTSGGATITITAAVGTLSGASSATQTYTITATITRGTGSSNNHTAVLHAEVVNASASGVTVA